MKQWTIVLNKAATYRSVFFDKSKAFDTVWRQGLMYKLHNLGIKGKLWQIIDDCHCNTVSAVIVNVEIFVPWFCQRAFIRTRRVHLNITKMRSGSQIRESYASWRYFLHRHIPSKSSIHDGYSLSICMQMALYIQRIKILRSKTPCQTQ